MNNDLISRQAVIDAIYSEREWLDSNIQDMQQHYHMMHETSRLFGIIGNLPTIQANQKTGHWIKSEGDRRGYTTTFQCPNCKHFIGTIMYVKECEYQYCPDCGAETEDTA